MRTRGARRARRLRGVAGAGGRRTLLSGCGGGSLLRRRRIPAVAERPLQPACSARRSQAVGENAAAAGGQRIVLSAGRIRAGASTYAVGLPGKQAAGNDLRYQATISRTARDCTHKRRSDHRADRHPGPRHLRSRRKSGDGRGPDSGRGGAGRRQGEDDRHQGLPHHRIDVGGRQRCRSAWLPRISSIRCRRGDRRSYIFYIGFDPQALTPEPKASRRRRSQAQEEVRIGRRPFSSAFGELR